jgi:hypothetical protein
LRGDNAPPMQRSVRARRRRIERRRRDSNATQTNLDNLGGAE